MNLPWLQAGRESPGKKVVTLDIHTLTPRDVTRRFYVSEYEPDDGRAWNAKMWARVSNALDRYAGCEDTHIVKRLAGITANVAKAIETAPDANKISIDKTQWVYLCTHAQTMEKAANDLRLSLKTFDAGRTLAAFVQDVNHMAQETGFGVHEGLEKLWGRSSKIRNLLSHNR